ncbi:MAG: glycine zipper 2TM domain-containing protein [Candidatus Paceibacteria bacterium]
MKKILAVLFISSSLLFASNNELGLDTLVGATLGVVVGNQIGKGTGKDVARVAGGLLGASIANGTRDSRNNNYNDNYNNNNYNSNYRTYDNYERTTTYVRDDYYDDDRYYNRRPAPSQVVVIYKDYDRRPPYRHYRPHDRGPRGHVYIEQSYRGR